MLRVWVPSTIQQYLDQVFRVILKGPSQGFISKLSPQLDESLRGFLVSSKDSLVDRVHGRGAPVVDICAFSQHVFQDMLLSRLDRGFEGRAIFFVRRFINTDPLVNQEFHDANLTPQCSAVECITTTTLQSSFSSAIQKEPYRLYSSVLAGKAQGVEVSRWRNVNVDIISHKD